MADKNKLVDLLNKGYTIKEVGQILGISRQYVHELMRIYEIKKIYK